MRRGEIWSVAGRGYASKPRPVLVVQSNGTLPNLNKQLNKNNRARTGWASGSKTAVTHTHGHERADHEHAVRTGHISHLQDPRPYLRRPVDVACRLVRADLDHHSARGPSRHAATDAMPDCENIPCGTRENRPMGDLPGVRGRGSIPAQHVPRHGQQTPVTPAMHALARMA